MKRFFFLSAVLLVAVADRAQTTNAPEPKAQSTPVQTAAATPVVPQSTNAQPLSETQTLTLAAPTRPALREAKPNEIISGKYLFSGAAIQAAKAKNPLQLVNPFAPAQYGSGFDNMEFDPTSGTGPTIKVFSIRF